MALCQAPVAEIKTLADAYDAANVNAIRLNQCRIIHRGLVNYETSIHGATK